MLVAEFLGASVLTLVVLSVQRSQLGLAYFVALAAGLAVATLTYMFSNISGAQMNPALTLALWTARRIRTLPALTYIVVQLLGAWAAYGLYQYFVNTDVQEINQAFSGRILVAEAIGAMVFALGWAAAAYNRVNEARFAAMAGLSFAAAIIIASAASVGLANPAVAVGARAWEVFGENGWGNYVLGPVLGAIIGVNLFGLLFADVERPFSALRRRGAAAAASASVSSTGSDVEVEETVLEEKAVKPAAKKRTTKAASTAAKRKTASTSKKTTTKRTTTK